MLRRVVSLLSVTATARALTFVTSRT